MVDRITPEEAYEKSRNGEAILLDVRTTSWNKSSVKAKGAHRLDPHDFESQINEIELPKDKEIITYCT